MRMTAYQRCVLGGAAGLIAVRLFLPVQYETRYGLRTDLLTTLLHTFAILAIATALVVLMPSPDLRRHGRLLPGAVLTGWLVFLLVGAVGVKRYGIAESIREVGWLPTGLALEAFLLLLSLTAISIGFRVTLSPTSRRKFLLGTLAAFASTAVLVGGFVLQRYWQQRQALQAQERTMRKIVGSIVAQDEAIALIQRRFGQQLRAAIAGARDDLKVRGWDVRDLGNGMYLVSYTFTLPDQDVRAMLQKDPHASMFLPCSPHLPVVVAAKNSNILGWWWEVWPKEQIVRTVNDVVTGGQKYGLVPIETQC